MIAAATRLLKLSFSQVEKADILNSTFSGLPIQSMLNLT
jgi:hypothetical protein